METDAQWMQQAIKLAEKGRGLTAPNPPVGAIIVKNNQPIGQGWHHAAGKPHAEREAIADALAKHPPEAMQNATIYITLEPCSSHGRTPPCTQGIIDAGITRAVYGATDPNPAHQGAAEKILTEANIQVCSGIEEQACQHLIRAFAKSQRTGLPWVLIKTAMSLDSHITRPPGEGQWLTSPQSRQHVQALRHESDAIITGGNTVRLDNPSLTIRDSSLTKKPQPWRMIITRDANNLPPDSHLFTDSQANRTIVDSSGDLTATLKHLHTLGCNQVMVEAGGKLLEHFLNSHLVDEVAIFYAPLLTGGPDTALGNLKNNHTLRQTSLTQIGNDVLLRALVNPNI